MKRWFKSLPIQRKMLLLTLAICGTALLTAATALVGFQILKFRSSFKSDTATLASIIANNSTAALAFKDQTAAKEILSSLKANPTILSASLSDLQEHMIAHYGKALPASGLSDFPPEGEFQFRNGHLYFTQAVRLDRKILGYLHLRSDYQSVFVQLLTFYGILLVGVFIASVLLAALLSGRLHRFIADPVLSLAETARIIGEKNDYSVRSPVAGFGDEIGELARSFNGMLERIQSQDAAINLSQQKLEGLVNSIDGVVWEWNPDKFAFTYISSQMERLFGFPAEACIGDSGFWLRIMHPEDRETANRTYLETLRKGEPYTFEYRVIAADGRERWVRESGVISVENNKPAVLRGILQDITEQKTAALELQKVNRQLLDASRQAGMAEVATGVLHNVGNVLNSVNVSATLLREKLNRSETGTLNRLAELIQKQNGSVASFLTEDPKGKLIPQFIVQIAGQLRKENEFLSRELGELGKNIDHIKDIVAMQQSYGRVMGVMEQASLANLVEDALRISAPSLTHASIEVVREFGPVPPITVDSHKVLQILINLIRNAKFAMEDSDVRRLTLIIRAQPAGRVQVVVQDSGVGIPPENLVQIFSHGFTTRKDGHGFGLHIGALNAKQMGGSLSAASPGVGLGATFTLELPLQPRETKV